MDLNPEFLLDAKTKACSFLGFLSSSLHSFCFFVCFFGFVFVVESIFDIRLSSNKSSSTETSLLMDFFVELFNDESLSVSLKIKLSRLMSKS